MTIGYAGTKKEYRLSFLEYDEQGMVFYPETKSRIMDEYREIASENDVLLITFFHGWHHNAKGQGDEDRDIVRFRDVLSTAAENHPSKEILGIYVGWKGRSLTGIFDYLTFWGRKHTAHEIGQQGGITGALLELEGIVKQRANSNSKMVTIGHSFGGAALYSTLNLVLTERYASSIASEPDGMVEGFGDLVVLLNPAFEAIRFSSLFELSQSECREYPDNQHPKLIMLSSGSDLAVRFLFRGGQLFNAISEKHKRPMRHIASRTAKAHAK